MKRKDKQGFTLAEMLIGILALSIFAMSAGLMLYHAWRGWYSSNDSVVMQRDTSLARSVLCEEIRCSSIDDITFENGILTFAAAGERAGSGAESIYKSGSNLIHTGPNGNFTLIAGTLMGFSAAKGADNVSISISSQTASGNEDNQTLTVYTRN